jgi:hypothetical protein
LVELKYKGKLKVKLDLHVHDDDLSYVLIEIKKRLMAKHQKPLKTKKFN